MNHLRTHDNGHKDTAAQGRRTNQDCKSVLIGTDTFEWLREFQSSTNPRLEVRYLLEAAVDLVRNASGEISHFERTARERLKRHLSSLDQ